MSIYRDVMVSRVITWWSFYTTWLIAGGQRGEWVDATVGHLRINITHVTSIAPVRQR